MYLVLILCDTKSVTISYADTEASYWYKKKQNKTLDWAHLHISRMKYNLCIWLYNLFFFKKLSLFLLIPLYNCIWSPAAFISHLGNSFVH